MKTKILLFLAACILLSACSRDEKNLFSDNADTRLSKALSNAETSFVGANNGWEMLYFPNTESCGYNILVKFNTNGQAVVAACNNLTTNDKFIQDNNSTWTVKADYGPLLSFDTYNDVLHAWADPQTDGDGYLGDYEFLILSANNTCARLKGKKHEAYTQMYPLADNVDWENYFKQVNDLRDQLFVGTEDIPMTIHAANREFKYVYRDGILQDPDSIGTEYFPIIIRPNVVQLYENGIYGAVHFTLNDAKNRLVCTDEGHTDTYIEPGIEAINYFTQTMQSKLNHWYYTDESSSKDVLTSIANIKNMAKSNGAVVERLSLCKTRLNGSSYSDFLLRVEFAVDQRQYAGFIVLNSNIQDGQLTISGGQADQSITPLLKRINANTAVALKYFTDIFCGTYTLQSYNGSSFIINNLLMISQTTQGKQIHIIFDNTTL